MSGRRPSLPALPAAPKKDLPRPFKTGDRVLHKHDIVASTNMIPGVSHKDSVGMERGITREEDRHMWTGPRAANRMADSHARTGRREYKRAVGLGGKR